MARSRKDLEDRATAHTVDGYARSRKAEEELNELAVATFGRGNGAKFLAYLKQITTSAHGAMATDAQLRHDAGMRYLVYIIETRMLIGQKERQNV